MPHGYGSPKDKSLLRGGLSFKELCLAFDIAESQVTAGRKEHGFLEWSKTPMPTLDEIGLAFRGHERGVGGLLNKHE